MMKFAFLTLLSFSYVGQNLTAESVTVTATVRVANEENIQTSANNSFLVYDQQSSFLIVNSTNEYQNFTLNYDGDDTSFKYTPKRFTLPPRARQKVRFISKNKSFLPGEISITNEKNETIVYDVSK